MYRWYVINTYSGHENKVKHNLEHRVQTMSQNRNVRQVVVPTEQVSEIDKDGQKVPTEKRTMPGYVLVNMEMTDDAWGLVKNTPGVTGFVGSRNKPVPLSKPEVDRLLHRETAERPAHPGPVLDRRVGQGHLRPALRLLRRDRRDQRGRRQTQGAGLDLRPRDAGRGRLRPGQEDLARPLPSPTRWPRKSSHSSSCRSRPAPPTRRRRSAPRWASTASTSWSSAKRSTRRPSPKAGRSSRSRSRSTRTAPSPSSPRRRRPRS